MTRFRTPILLLYVAALSALAGCGPKTVAMGYVPAGEARVHPGDVHFVDDFPALTTDGLVNVVVEIPAGTDGKWEVDKKDGSLRWQLVDGVPRVVQYLGYPGNYGMVPRTLLPKDLGGDGDPLDVLILGGAIPRGDVVPTTIIGVLELLDGGEQDDKLIAVAKGTPMADVTSLEDLEERFPGVLEITRTWFENYKGRLPDGTPKMVAKGYGDAARAASILDAAIAAYPGTPVPATSDGK